MEAIIPLSAATGKDTNKTGHAGLFLSRCNGERLSGELVATASMWWSANAE
jgi:hypothetical protein